MPSRTIARSQKNNKKKKKHKNNLQDVQIDVKHIKKIFKRKFINKIARASGLIQRTRKLEAFDFFIINIWGTKRFKTNINGNHRKYIQEYFKGCY